jgi:hypothetical protein
MEYNPVLDAWTARGTGDPVEAQYNTVLDAWTSTAQFLMHGPREEKVAQRKRTRSPSLKDLPSGTFRQETVNAPLFSLANKSRVNAEQKEKKADTNTHVPAAFLTRGKDALSEGRHTSRTQAYVRSHAHWNAVRERTRLS